MIRIAVTKGRIEKETCKLMKKMDFDTWPIENKDRKLTIRTRDNIEFVFTKSNDVLKLIEEGIADIGIIGKDTLEENENKNYCELLDLNIGKCYFALASLASYKEKVFDRKKKIATKYPNVAKKYFAQMGEEIEIVKMEGSIELAPIIGMTDGIVDLVETGNTLKANGLVVIDKIFDVSTRLISNKESLKHKSEEIRKIVNKFGG